MTNSKIRNIRMSMKTSNHNMKIPRRILKPYHSILSWENLLFYIYQEIKHQEKMATNLKNQGKIQWENRKSFVAKKRYKKMVLQWLLNHKMISTLIFKNLIKSQPHQKRILYQVLAPGVLNLPVRDIFTTRIEQWVESIWPKIKILALIWFKIQILVQKKTKINRIRWNQFH